MINAERWWHSIAIALFGTKYIPDLDGKSPSEIEDWLRADESDSELRKMISQQVDEAMAQPPAKTEPGIYALINGKLIRDKDGQAVYRYR